MNKPSSGRRRIGALIGACALVAASLATAQDATILYVATTGNDAWSGALDAPNAAGTDGPLATVAGARDAVRRLKTDGATGPVQVRVRAGAYAIAEPIVFGPEDSGTAEAPVSYEAYPGERPVIHGGRRIQGWQRDGDRWVADIPEVRDGAWDFSALWVNGHRCQPARTPNPA
ncbi:MAG: hypothetical protein JXR94_07920, partial [Candidatus Hydrogenedentes bacterium]|nr:hypothetical protein [Candidatus Hydrogenedentota bacterium]